MNNPKESQKAYLHHPDFGDIDIIADAQDFHLLVGLQSRVCLRWAHCSAKILRKASV